VLAVHGLLGDAEPLCDLLPGPSGPAGAAGLQDLQPLGEGTPGSHRAEAGIEVGADGILGDVAHGFYLVSIC
jgi:hypothetical protein